GATREMLVEACNGAPDSTFSNCTQDQVQALLDDSSTGGSTSSGVITSPTHASGVSNTGFTATGTTSPELTQVSFALEDDSSGGVMTGATGAGDDVDENDFVFDSTPDTTSATASTWSAAFNPDDNQEMGLTLADSDNGSMQSSVAADCENAGGDACAMNRV